MYKIKCISSLNKVFPWQEPVEDLEDVKLSAFWNEVLSFQCAYYGEGEVPHYVTLKIESELVDYIRVRDIVLMPSRYPCGIEKDENYLETRPGLYPDLLKENKNLMVHVVPQQWSSLFIDVELRGGIKSGDYTIKLIFESEEGKELVHEQIELRVYEGRLQEQKIKHTEWFYADCLADYYKVEVWSKEHWNILKNFIALYGKRGMNTILTPIFTPALDTAVGGERTTTQLVDIKIEEGHYIFNFDNLDRWINLCMECGIEYFEMVHLYTQWGAKYTPKIIATVDGVKQKIFGWHKAATDKTYKAFLSKFLPELITYLKNKGLQGKVYFHISDEPDEGDIESYIQAKKQVEEYVEGFPIIDALSRYAFFESGAVNHPIPGTNHIEDFLEKEVPGLWTYYCSAQKVKVSNRFFSMPLARLRMIGVQLYKFNIEGFLHWGFNFYNSRYSLKLINPYEDTDAGANFPSGDSFLVYPGEKGIPEESIRLMALFEAMEDICALETLETYTSKEYVVSILEEGLEEPLTFSNYPTSSKYLLKLRQRINQEINTHMNGCYDER